MNDKDPVGPERSDQIRRRKEKGSASGRPPAFDPLVYRDRNTVERGYARLKQWRAIATRYDKYALTFGGGVLLAATVINYRVHNEETRPSRSPPEARAPRPRTADCSMTGVRSLRPECAPAVHTARSPAQRGRGRRMRIP